MLRIIIPREIRFYATKEGKTPFREWAENLKDKIALEKIEARLTRLSTGNFGECKSVGKGIFEAKINYGPGYRIYFGLKGLQIIIVLCGGHKGSQQKDIQKAQQYWDEYRSEHAN